MGKIAILDQFTIDKIAAGEVVERPASVVKELVENAIDAGSSSITIEIKEGGISFIRITDNGMGIDKQQIQTAFLRHATSKITQVEDLHTISSLGFRGEALSSISAVSQVELITKTPDSFTGVRYEIHGGIEKTMEDIGAPNGTTFIIRNLFYNTPARSKFLKTATTEAGYISTYIEQLAMSHPNISFKYMVNGQNKLHTSGNGQLKDVIYSIYGRTITKELIDIDFTYDSIHITGYIAKPIVSRGNRNHENYYVNGRYVKSKIITKAIEDGYKSFMMQHKYPFTALCLTLDQTTIDINVHPTKMEVRFSDGASIYEAIHKCIIHALSHRELIPQVQLTQNPKETVAKESKKTFAEPFEIARKTIEKANTSKPVENYRMFDPIPKTVASSLEKSAQQVGLQPTLKPTLKSSNLVDITTGDAKDIQNQLSKNELPQNEQPPCPEQAVQDEPVFEADTIRETNSYGEQQALFEEKLLSEEARMHHRIIGQIFNTYWLVEFAEKLFIIDQHAAHEKVLYERIIQDLKTQTIHAQTMSPPMIVTLNMQEIDLLERHEALFAQFGFEITAFGGKEYAISAIPDNLSGLCKGNLFLEMLDHLSEESLDKPIDIITDKIASMACKAAVKGNHKLSQIEIEKLIDELLTLENPYNCPHGRPTIISMTQYELEKKFKRVL